MKKSIRFSIILTVIMVMFSTIITPVIVSAESTPTVAKYYFEKFVDAGKDTGYSENNPIKEGDPHSGWKIGRFRIDGYTRHVDKDGTPIFLKTVGDTVKLWFELEQDINKLNGDESLTISEDTNGYDEYFGIEKSNFGRGTLIVRKTDYQNHTDTYPPYTDYLAGVEVGAATEIQLCEEGDYEVALDYEVRKDNLDIFGWNPFPSYYNYRIYFKFSVRNGNCMVYPFDVKTKAELTNGAITENGFYLDLANSRNLSIDIKKEVRAQGAEGLTEDTRFNKPAKDHEEFTEEGIYTITAKNEYTDQTTTKIIYVGTDSILKAYAATGGKTSISEIEQLVADGAKIADDGTIILSSGEKVPHVEEESSELAPDDTTKTAKNGEVEKATPSVISIILIGIGVFAVIALVVIVSIKRKKRALEPKDVDGGQEE